MPSSRSKPPPATTDPLAASAVRAVVLAAGLLLLAATTGAAVRLLPWALDPQIGWGTLAPFAKSLLAVAVEAAVVTGWGVGWALAAQRLVERGEARVLASLGEPPSRTIARLASQAALFAAIVAFSSVALGREAAAPGRVVDALLTEGRVACASSTRAETRAVPFVAATWLCPVRGAASVRLVGRSPLGGIVFTASDAHVSEDLRRIDLEDARLVLKSPAAKVHVRQLVLRGLVPWARASALPPALRAVVVTLSGLAGASAAVYALLRVRRRPIGRVAATALGASGPLAALAVLRSLEVRMPDVLEGAQRAWLALFALVPVAAVAAVAGVVALVTLLPDTRSAGTK